MVYPSMLPRTQEDGRQRGKRKEERDGRMQKRIGVRHQYNSIEERNTDGSYLVGPHENE